MALEKMGEFFDNRLDGYEEHQLNCIENAKEFYPFTAAQLPKKSGSKILDLGCGTGLELSEYFALVPGAEVTGIDLAPGMLKALREKFPDKKLKLINASYFDVPFGISCFDAAVSVESLHHFTMEQKIPLYKKLHDSLKDGGYFILTDYIVEKDEEEAHWFSELERIKAEEKISDAEFYHYDTPLSLAHEKEALKLGGFTKTEELGHWENTHCLKAYK